MAEIETGPNPYAHATREEIGAATAAVAGHLRSSMLVLMIDVGHRLGLFTALAAGRATPATLAERAGCAVRPVEEWLGAVVTGGLVQPEADGHFSLSPAMVQVLSAGGPGDLSRLAATVTELAPVVPEVVEAFRTGEGVGYAAYRPRFARLMDAQSRPLFDLCLPDGYLAGVPDVVDRLRTVGGRVLDVGCGTGHATNVLARSLPAARCVGVDLDTEAVELAWDEAGRLGLVNASFVAADARSALAGEPWDLVTFFDVVHDLPDPIGMLRAVRDGLAPGGALVVVDVKAHTGLEHNLDHPMGPWMYGISTLHCLQVSLAGGGPGLGACWGQEQAEALLADAGFTVEVGRVPEDRANLVYTCRPG